MGAGWWPWEGLCGSGTVLLALSTPTQCAAGWLDSEVGMWGRAFLMTVDCIGPGPEDLGTWARGSQVQAAWAQPASPLKWNLAHCPVWFEIRATGPGLPRALAAREG